MPSTTLLAEPEGKSDVQSLLQGDADSSLQPGASAAEEVYEEAVAVLPTSKMYSLYCTFLAERLAAAQSSQDRQTRGHARHWTKILLAAHNRAIATGLEVHLCYPLAVYALPLTHAGLLACLIHLPHSSSIRRCEELL